MNGHYESKPGIFMSQHRKWRQQDFSVRLGGIYLLTLCILKFVILKVFNYMKSISLNYIHIALGLTPCQYTRNVRIPIYTLLGHIRTCNIMKTKFGSHWKHWKLILKEAMEYKGCKGKHGTIDIKCQKWQAIVLPLHHCDRELKGNVLVLACGVKHFSS